MRYAMRACARACVYELNACLWTHAPPPPRDESETEKTGEDAGEEDEEMKDEERSREGRR